ncbi:hypothetical protein ACHAW5_000219 [Stephanodiscus triporus]|uniref:Apoptosis-antagonizing transcription factor C-terminal domain-containing protein n=1 Tax=Stephanodiscus triporus TaxID=2934178 RepID=A0ABD3P8L5_9STRA
MSNDDTTERPKKKSGTGNLRRKRSSELPPPATHPPPPPSSSSSSSSRLFSALASIEEDDGAASARRVRSRVESLRRSHEASRQMELNGSLLELRILVQRCMTEEEEEEEEEEASSEDDDGSTGRRRKASLAGVDALLENLLEARRELAGGWNDDDDDNNNDEDGVDRTRPTDGECDDDDDEEDALAERLKVEYSYMRDRRWMPTLDRLHAGIVSRMGGGSSSFDDGGGGGGGGRAESFRGKALGTSFWEQVRGTAEYERSRSRGAGMDEEDEEEEDGGSRRRSRRRRRPTFDDSRLYQHMLSDFVSSRSTNERGGGRPSDPAREAAERLGRALRKRRTSGGSSAEYADVDIASLYEVGVDGKTTNKAAGGGGSTKKKTTTIVDRRASKGRKIRYAIVPKLVNFTFPVSRPEPAISEDVWFKSLFGGGGEGGGGACVGSAHGAEHTRRKGYIFLAEGGTRD